MPEFKNLDALANQLYHDGMQKAEIESEKILKDAQKRAEEILDNAQNEANELLSKTKKEAEKYRSSIENEVHQHAKQAIENLKHQIKALIVAQILDNSTKELLSDSDFTKELILTSMEGWKDGQDLDVTIPKKIEEMKTELEQRIHKHLPGLIVTSNEHIETGFKIEHKEKGYVLSFTDHDFKEFFQPYLSKRVSEILFDLDQ